MTALALLFTLAAIGISETMYLIRKRTAAEEPLCFIGEDCTVVLSSKYRKIFLVPNDVLGLLAYVVIAILAALLVIDVGPLNFLKNALTIMITVASVVSYFKGWAGGNFFMDRYFNHQSAGVLGRIY